MGDKKTWHAARDACRSMNAQLAMVKTDATHNYIRKLPGKFFWIGVHDLNTVNKFENVDGTPVEKTYWNPGEPNGANVENCVHYYAKWGRTNEGYLEYQDWNDETCTTEYTYLCQRRPALELSSHKITCA